ncbi:MAG TPA: hypothetical protein VFQ53_30530 [Kofleriaceae bacterium]|nr:hypothetical protein [Kofleriaceae bacterium]
MRSWLALLVLGVSISACGLYFEEGHGERPVGYPDASTDERDGGHAPDDGGSGCGSGDAGIEDGGALPDAELSDAPLDGGGAPDAHW